MNKTGVFLLSAAFALAQSSSRDGIGPTFIMGGAGTLKSGITIQFATYAIPGGGWGAGYGRGGIDVGTDTLHRSVVDSAGGSYFGYDLTFASDAAGGYQAVFRPLSRVPASSRLTVPKFPAPQPVHDGDTIALDLMVRPDGTQRIVDYIRISLRPPEPAPPVTTAEPGDFTLDDGAVTYDAAFMTIWVDGHRETATAGFTQKPGATFWITFPGQGRYILSLLPHPGSAKTGVVRDNVLAFQDGGRKYEVRFMSPIAGAGKAWNLYVARDASARSQPQSPGMIRCGVDRWENLAPGR